MRPLQQYLLRPGSAVHLHMKRVMLTRKHAIRTSSRQSPRRAECAADCSTPTLASPFGVFVVVARYRRMTLLQNI